MTSNDDGRALLASLQHIGMASHCATNIRFSE
jgi:hypothetical protein